jgi:hypothetical protein
MLEILKVFIGTHASDGNEGNYRFSEAISWVA